MGYDVPSYRSWKQLVVAGPKFRARLEASSRRASRCTTRGLGTTSSRPACSSPGAEGPGRLPASVELVALAVEAWSSYVLDVRR